MRAISMGILVLLLSCSSSPQEKGGGSAETTDQPSAARQNCSDLPDIDLDKEFHVLKTTPVSLQPGDIKKDDAYQLIDKAFYDRYLYGSDKVHDWIRNTQHPPDLQTKHFYWGVLQLANGMCQFIIYEHHSYSGNEDRLLLINVNEDGRRIGIQQVAGMISSPGGEVSYSSKIWEDRLHIFKTEKGIIDRKPGKSKYQKDSVVVRYRLAGQQIELTGRDSTRQVYWE